MTAIILGLETATDACSVALTVADQLYFEYTVEPQAHSKLLLGMVDLVCKQAGIGLEQIDAFAFGKGPGSFTGLRIAASVVQGLAFGSNKPVIAISSLQALAQQAFNKSSAKQVVAILDARMQEIYCGTYENVGAGHSAGPLDDCLQKPEDLLKELNPEQLLVGTGAKVYHSFLSANNPKLNFDLDVLYPRAQEIVQLAIAEFAAGKSLPAGQALPVYIRNNVVQVGKKNPD
jgi:tRNA threonylcarbamoyladenosine biosynthesis protein TsaB